MATNTYVALDKITVGSNTPSVSFTSIPSTYTDLVLVVNAGMATADVSSLHIRVGNGSVDTGSNYSSTDLMGDGTSATSGRTSNETFIRILGRGTTLPNTITNNSIVSIMNYANTSTYKTLLVRGNVPSKKLQATAGLWRSTAAINTITISDYESSTNILAGSTFSLYGIKAEPVSTPSAKATGGTISYSIDGYTYHTFTSTGNFVPSTSLTCDVLAIAGGGSGTGGGGGAGGVVYHAGRTISSSTTATIGGGGTTGGPGTNTTFDTITCNGGGAGGYNGTYGSTGGSGGGNDWSRTATVAATQGNSGGGIGYGNAGGGGSGVAGSGYAAGGGGGAGTAGVNGAANKGGNGGNGLNTWASWAGVTGTGVGGYYAGGGGAGVSSTPSGTGGLGGGGRGGSTDGSYTGEAGVANTGSGSGGQGTSYYNGGSGIVIIRYATV